MGKKSFLVTCLASLLMWALLGAIALGIAGAAGWVQEDDTLFNCHLMGDMHCGDGVPWHGFVNF
jgi:hypothetical protein